MLTSKIKKLKNKIIKDKNENNQINLSYHLMNDWVNSNKTKY